MVKAVAYGRVSTNKDEQLDSLETQQSFFEEYARKNGYDLIKIYADEGKTGTRMKNRNQLIQLLSDAHKQMFEVVLIKDISRLARNVVDFLTSIRQLKSLGIKVIFVNYDQTSSDSSEFMLTMLSAIAQEESYNTSKRIKFGKKVNAEKGRVPNLVFGYDKTPGDYFNLTVNESEAEVVKEIFDMYVNKNLGANKIAQELNFRNIKTKRNAQWTQIAVSRLLRNLIYTGRVINGKEEVKDFLTGERKGLEKEQWIVMEKPELRLISDELFERAKRITGSRKEAFKRTKERNSQKHTFSKMIKCEHCGASFRRCERKYKNTYIKWVCATRNTGGVHSCPNNVVVDEDILLKEIKNYFLNILKDKENITQNILKELDKQYKNINTDIITEKEIKREIERIKKSKKKYMDMYEAEIISLGELKEYTKDQNEEIKKLNNELELIKESLGKNDSIKNILNEKFKDISCIISSQNINNTMLRQIIDKITVSKEGDVNIYFKFFSEYY